MKTTDDIIHEFHELGITLEEATDMAWEYIATEIWTSTKEFAETVRLGEIEFSDAEEIDIENNLTDMDIEFDLDHEIEAPQRIFEIGCDYQGDKEISEEDRTDIYIPSSYYCILKCYEKSFERNKEIIDTFKYPNVNNEFEISRMGVSPYGLTNKNAKKIYAKSLRKYLFNLDCTCTNLTCDNCKNENYNVNHLIPEHYKIKDKKIFTISRNKNKTIINDCILLGHLHGSFYHAILLKQKTPKKLKEYNLKVKFMINKKLEFEQVRIKKEYSKEKEDYIIVYDIETYWNDESPRKAIPYALSFSLVDLKNYKSRKPEMITIKNYDNIFNEFFERMICICKELELKKIQVFAHNGSRFDNIFVKSATNAKIYSSIIVGTNNKKIIFEKQSSDGDKIFFEFKDTLPFVLSTLKKALKDYKCQIQKKELDIANYTFEMYQNRTDWIEYLEYDVKGLAELSMRINDSLMDYGESITTCLGAPSFAWKLMRKLCYNSDYFYCPKSPSLKKFMRQACYGGRILQWKKLFDPKTQSKMICLDFNSLYPSAMHKFSYPVGMAEPIVKPDGPIDDIKNFKDYLFSPEYPHYIIEVTFDAGNIRYPIHPYKTEKRNLIYKSGVFTGVYNDVDVREMIRDGYKVVNIKDGIYWQQSEKIFTHLIKTLYELRKIQKQNNDEREYTTKIILNSIFGKFMECIKTVSSYNKPKHEEYIIRETKLKNGQTEYITKMVHDMDNNPVYIGGYIMSYARKLMNEYIDMIGRDKIYYSDTDSLYIELSDMKNIKLGEDLGEMKNDYGDGKYITEAYFLDLKRYLLIFNDGTAKAKFLGLNFKHIDVGMTEQLKIEGEDNINKIRLLFKDLMNTEINKTFIPIIQEKWSRINNEIKIDTKSISYSISPSARGKWINDEYYSINYNFNEEERIINKLPDYITNGPLYTILNKKEIFYRIIRNVVKSKVPLVFADKTIPASVLKIQTEFYSNNNIIYKKIGDRLQKICKYGITCEKSIEIPKDAVQLASIRKNSSLSYIPALSKEDMFKISKLKLI
jgi:hypothetical protein